MRFTEAKNTQIIDYLLFIGIKHEYIKNQNAWFLSPFRNETTPSFKTDLVKNIWYDFGEGTGGNIIDLVMKLHSVTITEALNILENKQKPSFSFDQQQKVEIKQSGTIDVYQVKPLKRSALVNYLLSRAINIDYATKYLHEGYYKVNDRSFFALAFKNDLGGFELRNKHFKNGSSPKLFTTIPGINHNRINVFEGFMDFLSVCTHYKRVPECDTIVLNGVKFVKKIDSILQNAKEINLFLDNDTAGEEAAQYIMIKFEKVTDW